MYIIVIIWHVLLIYLCFHVQSKRIADSGVFVMKMICEYNGDKSFSFEPVSDSILFSHKLLFFVYHRWNQMRLKCYFVSFFVLIGTRACKAYLWELNILHGCTPNQQENAHRNKEDSWETCKSVFLSRALIVLLIFIYSPDYSLLIALIYCHIYILLFLSYLITLFFHSFFFAWKNLVQNIPHDHKVNFITM